MKCKNCNRETNVKDNLLRFTILERFIAVHLINCTYNYCKRCDKVFFSDNDEKLIRQKVNEAQPNSRVTINF